MRPAVGIRIAEAEVDGPTVVEGDDVATRLFAGRQKSGLVIGDGGAWVSTNEGKSFTAIGLPGATVGQLSFNGTHTKLYAAAYASGVYISPMP